MEDTKGERLKRYLQSIKMSNETLGDILGGITGSAVGNWTRGKQKIPDEQITRILRAFSDMNADWFMNNRGPMKAKEMDTSEEPALPYSTIEKHKSEIESLKKVIDELKEDKRFLKESLRVALRQRGDCTPGEIEGGVEKHGKTG